MHFVLSLGKHHHHRFECMCVFFFYLSLSPKINITMISRRTKSRTRDEVRAKKKSIHDDQIIIDVRLWLLTIVYALVEKEKATFEKRIEIKYLSNIIRMSYEAFGQKWKRNRGLVYEISTVVFIRVRAVGLYLFSSSSFSFERVLFLSIN